VARTAFVGRHGELERLAGVLRGDTGSAGAILVTGDAGIGKSRLLAEAAAATPDVAVLTGSCLPLSESLPYGAITDAFDHLTGLSGRAVLDKALSRCAPFVRPQISALIPALSDQAQLTSSDVTADRSRLFIAVRDLLAALGADRRTALVVEDLHWADPGTLDLLTFLVRGLPPGTALVATSRRTEVTAGSPVLEWLDTTSRLATIQQVTLGPLRDGDVASIVTSLVGGDPAGRFVVDVGSRGQGNPFFTEQLVAAARDVAPPLELPRQVPPGVAQMLLARVRSVDIAASEVAAVLAVAARPLGEREVATCVGTGVAVAAGLRELLDTHLAEPAEQDRYRLRHALLEDAVRETLLASQRATLHAGIANVLVARGGENPGEVAAHWAQAGSKAEEARWSVAAARHAEALFAWRAASRSWRQVWDLWSSVPEAERPDVDLAEVVVACVRDAARVDLAGESSESFLELAREALADDRVSGDDYTAGRLLDMYGSRLTRTDKAAGMAALEQSVALFERAGRPSVEHARAIGYLVVRRIVDGGATGTEDDELAHAVAIAEECADLDAVLNLTSRRGEVLMEAGRVDEALAVLRQARQRAVDGDARGGHLAVALALTESYWLLLRLRDGVDVGRIGIDHAVRDGFREDLGFSYLVSLTVDCLLLLGETEVAADLVADYMPRELTVNGWYLHLSRAELDVLAGEPAVVVESLEKVEALNLSDEEVWLWQAEIGAAADLWAARADSAWKRIDQVWARVRRSPLASRAGRTLSLAAWAAADLADADPALDRQGLARQLKQWAEEASCFAGHPGLVLGSAFGVTFDAELARLGRSGEESAWRTAKDTWASYDVPHNAAYAGWRLAACLLDRGRRNDAQDELVAAYAAAQHHQPLRREIETLARLARLPLGDAPQMPDSQAPAAKADTAAIGLTPRELDVLRLLGTGASNDQIARRLYISPKTASVHVTHIYRKLGVNGRFQAAMVAQRMGLLTTNDGDR
jgi:DNA-binding CsgD family transcriptional regulator